MKQARAGTLTLCQHQDGPPTLISFLRLRLKQANRILRWPGFRPSTMEGMERSKSALENRMSSCVIRGANVSHVPQGESARDGETNRMLP